MYAHLAKDNCTASTHSCCHRTAEHKAKEEAGSAMPCCTNNICNPFAACTCCFYFTSAHGFNFSLTAAAEAPAYAELSFRVSGYAASCFHPPEMA
jgi:hypothetical protein